MLYIHLLALGLSTGLVAILDASASAASGFWGLEVSPRALSGPVEYRMFQLMPSISCSGASLYFVNQPGSIVILSPSGCLNFILNSTSVLLIKHPDGTLQAIMPTSKQQFHVLNTTIIWLFLAKSPNLVLQCAWDFGERLCDQTRQAWPIVSTDHIPACKDVSLLQLRVVKVFLNINPPLLQRAPEDLENSGWMRQPPYTLPGPGMEYPVFASFLVSSGSRSDGEPESESTSESSFEVTDWLCLGNDDQPLNRSYP